MAELIPVSSKLRKGFISAGVRSHTGIVDIPAGQTVQIPYKVGGILMLKNGYIWDGYAMYWAYSNEIQQIQLPSNGVYITLSISDGIVSLSSAASQLRTCRYVILNLAEPNDYSSAVQD